MTSYSSSAAKAMGKKEATAHDKRYDEAHEYMELVYSLWQGSWEDGAKVIYLFKSFSWSETSSTNASSVDV